jgi:hypothetical protein
VEKSVQADRTAKTLLLHGTSLSRNFAGKFSCSQEKYSQPTNVRNVLDISNV